MKSNHILIPIGIAGVVVAVWAALRKTGTATTVVVQPNPSLQTGMTPIGAPPVNINIQPTPAQPVNAAVPGTSASGVPNYSAQTQMQAGGSPQPAPVAAASVPSFYGPIQQFIASMMPVSEPSAPTPAASSSCGCGGKCGGGSGMCNDPCAATNSRFPDGRGACLAFSRKTQIAAMDPMAFMSASRNVQTSNVNLFDVFQQTVFDHAQRMGEVPASPFLSPV